MEVRCILACNIAISIIWRRCDPDPDLGTHIASVRASSVLRGRRIGMRGVIRSQKRKKRGRKKSLTPPWHTFHCLCSQGPSCLGLSVDKGVHVSESELHLLTLSVFIYSIIYYTFITVSISDNVNTILKNIRYFVVLNFVFCPRLATSLVGIMQWCCQCIQCVPKTSHFLFLNNSMKISRFQQFWYIESWGNLRLVGYKFAHFTWKVTVHYLVKFRTIIVTSLLQKYDNKIF